MMEKFRLIIDKAEHGAVNMGKDYAILKNCRSFAIPTLRLYQWKPSAVTIGYFQMIDEETDVSACNRDNIPLIRRITGGGAVFHQYEITYSAVFPLPHPKISGTILESYRILCQPIVESLKELGLDAEFSPINDITVCGRKISGNAQTRREGGLLQHGTILMKIDAETMFKYLKVPQKKTESKGNVKPAARVTSLEVELGEIHDYEETVKKINSLISKNFSRVFMMQPVEMDLDEKEASMSSDFKNRIFSNYEWNFKR